MATTTTATTTAMSLNSTTSDLLVSLTAFGLVSLVVTVLERRKQQQRRQQQSTSAVPRPPPPPHMSHPPERLVQYLHEHGGKKWQSYDVDTELFVRACPKVELHVHLDGSLDPDFLWHCLKQYDNSSDSNQWISCLPVNATLPWDAQHPLPVRHLVQSCKTVDDFHELCTCRRGQRSLQDMLTCFEIFLPLVRGAPPSLLIVEELAYDFCRRQWEQNVVYTEVRHCPHLLMRDDKNVSGSFDMDSNTDGTATSANTQKKQQQARLDGARSVLQAITRGLRRGCVDYTIVVNQILCAINWRPDWAWDVLALAQEFRTERPCGVVGIDIAAGEEHFDQHTFPNLYQAHFDMMQKAQELGIPIAIHAGETPNGIDHVRRAVASYKDKDRPGYGARRIGHGYRMADSVELMQQLAKDKIHVEICPTSSVETGGWMFDESLLGWEHETASPPKKKKPWKDHPGLKMMKHGIPISLNSDDPAVFHTSLAWQYRIALVKMGLTRQEVVRTNIHALEASFGRPEEKEKGRSEVQSFLASIASGEKVGTTHERFTDRVRDPF